MSVSIPDLSAIFEAYEKLASYAEALFTQVRQLYLDCVTCKSGCSDCCHAIFDLSLVEAMYLNHRFISTFTYGAKRSAIMQAAAEVDRPLTKLKRHYYEEVRDRSRKVLATSGSAEKSAEEVVYQAFGQIMEDAAKARVRCPLLLSDDTCALYDARPITCRLYGVPTVIDGKAHVCGKSGFNIGEAYPTVQLDKIQNQLETLSLEIQQNVHSSYSELHKVYVPVSMALLTNYDANYLGIKEHD